MRRASLGWLLLGLSVAVPPTTGCGKHAVAPQASPEAAQRNVAPSTAPPGKNVSPPGARSRASSERRPLISALLKALDEAEVESNDDRDALRRMILDAEPELNGVLGENSKRAILEANRRLPELVIEPPRPSASAEPKKAQPAEPNKAQPAQPPAKAADDENSAKR